LIYNLIIKRNAFLQEKGEELMENRNIVEKIIEDRIIENKEMFNRKEIELLLSNFNATKKVYLIGLINGKQIYGKN
jgi:hypothetical protein